MSQALMAKHKIVPNTVEHSWLHRELYSQQICSIRIQVINALWEKNVTESDLTVGVILSELGGLQHFLSTSIPITYSGNADQYTKSISEKFVCAIKDKNRENFEELFSSLTLAQLDVINKGEKLLIDIPDSKHQLPNISKKSIQLLHNYIVDTGCLAAVSITSNGASYNIVSEGIDPQAPFSIHSVGKVFTGFLMLLAIRRGIISEDNLDKPIQLACSVKNKLPEEVQQRLDKVTLKQIMLHESGLGDYCNKYCHAIHDAISQNQPIPDIQTCHDLLKYADPDVGSPRYSNLGILLVGLAIEHAYNEKTINKKPYEEILRELIINPVGMSVFSTHRPSNGQYNPDDPLTQHLVASPAGGYWTTVNDLQKFGNWIVQCCHEDPELLRLLEAHGGEFYSSETKELTHFGEIGCFVTPASSAVLVSSLEKGITVAILSAKGDVAHKLHSTIVRQSSEDNSNDSKPVTSFNVGFFKQSKNTSSEEQGDEDHHRFQR